MLDQLCNLQFVVVEKCYKRWFKFFHGFTFGSIFSLIILSLLHVQFLPSFGSKQKLKTAEAIVSSMYVCRGNNISKIQKIIKVKVVTRHRFY